MDHIEANLLDNVRVGKLLVARVLHDFVMAEAIPGTGIDPAAFWHGFGALVRELAPRNKALLEQRDAMQQQIDAWHRAHGGQADRPGRVSARSCARSATCSRNRRISPSARRNVDAEIARIAGPQLVVPVTNARYALNAANARWGSLYDALYGTDAIPEDGGATRGRRLQQGPRREGGGARRAAVPRPGGAARRRQPRRRDVAMRIETAGAGRSRCGTAARPACATRRSSSAIAAMRAAPSAVLLRHHGLHIEIVIDRDHPIGTDDPAGVADVVLEVGDHHHPGLRGFDRRRRCRGQGARLPQLARPDERHAGGHVREGRPHDDAPAAPGPAAITRPGGGTLTLPGRSLMLVRNVGHHMYTDAVLRRGRQRRSPRGSWTRRSPR